MTTTLQPTTGTRAFYRGYVKEGQRARQRRLLHVLRDNGPQPGQAGYCSVIAHDVTRSQTTILDPMPATAPAGLRWCAVCIGRLAHELAALDAVAALLASLAVR